MTGLCGSELGTCGESIVSLDDRWKAKGKAFRVQLLDASGGTFDQYGQKAASASLKAVRFECPVPNGTSTVYSPNWWIKVEEDPECIKEEEHAEETTNDRPS